MESIKIKIISKANANNVNRGDDVQYSRTCLKWTLKAERKNTVH